MARPRKDTVQISLRIERSWLKDVEAAGTVISRPGFAAATTDVIRAAIARGLTEILKDAGLQVTGILEGNANEEPNGKQGKGSSKSVTPNRKGSTKKPAR